MNRCIENTPDYTAITIRGAKIRASTIQNLPYPVKNNDPLLNPPWKSVFDSVDTFIYAKIRIAGSGFKGQVPEGTGDPGLIRSTDAIVY